MRISDWSSDVCSSDLGQFRPGQQFTDGLEHGARGPQMVVVPHGAYRMGAGADDTRADDIERPQHAIRFDRGFAMSITEVTVGDYRRFIKDRKSTRLNSSH